MGKEHIQFTYSTDTHITSCIRHVHGKEYIGIAKCHPDDYNFEAKLVGEHYAYVRSLIREMCDQRDELVLRLKTLKHMQTLLTVEKYNYKDALYLTNRQIDVTKRDLTDIRELIQITKVELRKDMNKRDELHTKLLERRKQQENSIVNDC